MEGIVGFCGAGRGRGRGRGRGIGIGIGIEVYYNYCAMYTGGIQDAAKELGGKRK